MDLFEILFVALFILFPIMEQVLKRKRTPGPPGDEEAPDRPDEVGRSDGSEGRGRDSALPPGREPGKASDMVPADLWAVLTGERSSTAGSAPTSGVEQAGAEKPRQEPGQESRGREEWVPDEVAWSPAPARSRRSGSSAPWSIDDDSVLEKPAPAPVSLEHYGPEAYSLERLDQEAVSLERPVPSAEARHRQFHALVDRPPTRRRARRSSLGRALRSPGSLRHAFVLTEVLGPPKGLND